MSTCTNCGTQLNSHATHCHFCGVETKSYQAQRRCINCGAAVATAAKTCIHCQNSIDELAAESLPTRKILPIVGVSLFVITVLVFLLSPSGSSAVVALVTPNTTTATPISNTTTPTASSTATPTPTISPTFTQTPTPTPTPLIHAIRRGETLIFIADKYGITVNDIVRANRITEDTLLQLGANLIIPAANTIPGAVVSDGQTVLEYTVQAGDTLFGLALRYDVSLATLSLANSNIDLDLLSIGQKILIPVGGSILTVTPTSKRPTPTFTPGPAYLKPELLWPKNGDVVEGDGVTVRLSWLSREVVAEDVYYVITLVDEAGAETIYWTQNGSYALPITLKPIDLKEFWWSVVIMRQTAITDDDNFEGKVLSEVSEKRQFLWR